MSEATTQSWFNDNVRTILAVIVALGSLAGIYAKMAIDSATLKAQQSDIVYRLDDMKNNHLMHIQDSLAKMEEDIKVVTVKQASIETRLDDHITSTGKR